MVQHKKFPQRSPELKKKKKVQIQRAMEKRQLNEAPKEAPKKKTKESEKLKEKAMPIPKKIKFGRRATDEVKPICSSIKETNSRIIMIGTIPISLNCSTTSLTL